MPTYGYRCTKCGKEFEMWQSIHDDAGATCPHCGGAGKRMIFPSGVVFKGAGFYKTDSRGSETGPKSSSEPKPSEPAPAKTETKTDASPPASSD